MKKKTSMLLLVLLGLVCVVSATQAQEAVPGTDLWTAPARAAKKKNPITADETSVAAGKVLYTQNCLSCHGTEGKGDGPASKDLEKKAGNLSDPTLRGQTDGAIFWKLTEGSKPMPSFLKTLSEDERWNVINYIRTLVPKAQ